MAHSPRTAAVLFANALSRTDSLEPPAVREPIRNMLTAGIELCVVRQNVDTLLGLPMQDLLDLAEALVKEGKSG
jgi:hypothetical protein